VKSLAERETLCQFCGRRKHLRDLEEETPQWWEHVTWLKVGDRQKVPVDSIVGSIAHGADFRPDWTPFNDDERDLEVLSSMKERGFDPEESRASPISLVRCRGEYFVEGDGHRRVSAARRLSLATIEAEVYELRPDA